MSLVFGSPDRAWERYDILQYPLVFNSKETRAKAIVRGEDLISIAGKGYTLLPNEEALKLADEAAELVGFKKFSERLTNGNWESGNVRGHVLCNEKDTQMHALYVAQDVDPTMRGDSDLYVGVDVQNSIDGRKSFGVGIFSFRSACKNGVIFGKKEIESVRHPHTAKLKDVISQLKNLFVMQMDKAKLIREGYQELATEKATRKLLEALSKTRIPTKVLPEYIKDPEQSTLITDLTVWDVYNDVTEAIWHNAKTDLPAKEFQFNQLHKVVPLIRVK